MHRQALWLLTRLWTDSKGEYTEKVDISKR